MRLRNYFRELLVLAIFLTTITTPALGRNSERDTAIWGISGGAALFSMLDPTKLSTAFIGGFEIGFGIGCLIWHDPPDPDNAGISVDLSDYFVYQMPNALDVDPSMDPSLASAIDVAMNDLDLIVALSRAVRTTLDRYEGALLIGREDWANDRWREFLSFNQQIKAAGKQSHLSLDALIEVFDMVDPSILDTAVTKQATKDIRDQIASGKFPSVDNLAISSWALTNDELIWLQDLAGDLEDVNIDNAFAVWDPVQGEKTTLGYLLSYARDNICENCYYVPESSAAFMFIDRSCRNE